MCVFVCVKACKCVFSKPSLALMMMSGWKTLQEEESGVMVKDRSEKCLKNCEKCSGVDTV